MSSLSNPSLAAAAPEESTLQVQAISESKVCIYIFYCLLSGFFCHEQTQIVTTLEFWYNFVKVTSSVEGQLVFTLQMAPD